MSFHVTDKIVTGKQVYSPRAFHWKKGEKNHDEEHKIFGEAVDFLLVNPVCWYQIRLIAHFYFCYRNCKIKGFWLTSNCPLVMHTFALTYEGELCLINTNDLILPIHVQGANVQYIDSKLYCVLFISKMSLTLFSVWN